MKENKKESVEIIPDKFEIKIIKQLIPNTAAAISQKSRIMYELHKNEEMQPCPYAGHTLMPHQIDSQQLVSVPVKYCNSNCPHFAIKNIKESKDSDKVIPAAVLTCGGQPLIITNFK